jgi:hypothetical protein
VIEVARIKGKIFKTMKEAEAHGLELAREWWTTLRNVYFLLSCGSSGRFLFSRDAFHAAQGFHDVDDFATAPLRS